MVISMIELLDSQQKMLVLCVLIWVQEMPSTGGGMTAEVFVRLVTIGLHLLYFSCF